MSYAVHVNTIRNIQYIYIYIYTHYVYKCRCCFSPIPVGMCCRCFLYCDLDGSAVAFNEKVASVRISSGEGHFHTGLCHRQELCREALLQGELSSVLHHENFLPCGWEIRILSSPIGHPHQLPRNVRRCLQTAHHSGCLPCFPNLLSRRWTTGLHRGRLGFNSHHR